MEKEFFQTAASPEAVGISSGSVQKLIDTFNENGLYMHSILLIRHGQIAAEGYWAPFTKDTKHRMYSSTKSFVAGAIGLLCDEGKVSLSDPVHKFFPEFPPETLHPYIRETTVRDLLTMSSPHITTYSFHKDGWVKSFFEAKPNRPGGTVFRYDTSATYILDVIVERITGQTFIDYMKDKMLREVGFSEDARCVESPDGYSWGGSGLLCTTRDMARYAYILLNKGNVCGKQLLSEDFVRQATSKQVPTSHCRMQPNCYGYGYQIWRHRDMAFTFNGMGNQIVMCYPDKDLIFVCTADNQGIQYSYKLVYDTVYHEIIETLSDTPLPENPAAFKALQNTVSGLSLHMPEGMAESPLQKEIDGVEYVLDENPMGIEKLSVSFTENGGVLRYTNARGDKEIPFGLGEYKAGEFPETHYSGNRIGTPLGRGYKMLAAGVWPSETNLVIRVNIADDYFGNLTVALGYRDDKIGVTMDKFAEAFLDDYAGIAGGAKKQANQ